MRTVAKKTNRFLLLAAGFFLVVGCYRNLRIVSMSQTAMEFDVPAAGEWEPDTRMTVPPPTMDTSEAEPTTTNATNTTDSNNKGTTRNSNAALASSLPLRPPFRIVLLGEERSGSTFNHQLLYALARVKTPPNQNVRLIMNSAPGKGASYVSKAHNLNAFKNATNFLKRARNGDISLFISTNDREHIQYAPNMTSQAWHVQEVANLRSCSLCEVDAYIDIFNLTHIEVQQVKEYMGAYETIRQCCGLQSSKWEQMRLAGCTITKEEKESPLYPHCEDRNKTEAEWVLASRPGGIAYVGMHPKFNWMKVGDCQRFDEMIRNGKGFNGKRFKATEKSCNKRKEKGEK